MFRDLRPYVCTFEDCRNAEKLYVTRSDWIYHVVQLHQRRWVCGGTCDLSFVSPNLLKQHMLEYHASAFTELQLPVLLDMCERPASLDEKVECQLCIEEMMLHDFNNHVAAHLEELALFVLPARAGDDDPDDNSDRAEGIDGSFDANGLSVLSEFSEGEAPEKPFQDAKKFARLLEIEEDDCFAQVGGWLKDEWEEGWVAGVDE